MTDDDRFSAGRLAKVELLRALGVDPYPAAAFSPTETISEVVANGEDGVGDSVRVAGRLLSIRSGGGLTFADLSGQGEVVQLMFDNSQMNGMSSEIVPLLSTADIVGCDGEMTLSRRGQLSIMVSEVTVLCKPVIDSPIARATKDRVRVGGMKDAGELRRARHIELMNDETARNRFIVRSQIIQEIRAIMAENDFLEVDTPILSPFYGGAAADPFLTRINVFDEQWFLRISPEMDLKRALVAGFDRVYSLGSNFRNEGIDRSHQCEFTMIEFYQGYSDYMEQMELLEGMVERVCEVVHGTTSITYGGRAIDFATPWPRVRIIDAVSDATGVAVGHLECLDEAGMQALFSDHGIEIPDGVFDWGVAVMALYEELAEEGLSWDPVHIIDYPRSVCPLTKPHRDNPLYSERYESMVAGMEIANSYSEQNDPVQQRELLSSPSKHGFASDSHFLDAIDCGMPQAGGTGMGIDRVVMIMTDTHSIQDVVLFPITKRDVD